MEKDINQWTAASIPEMSDIVCLSEEEKAEAHLVTFQVRACQPRVEEHEKWCWFRQVMVDVIYSFPL